MAEGNSGRSWLLLIAAWFILWTLVAQSSLNNLDRAEQAWFEADQRRDWPAAEHHRLEARSARQLTAVAAGVGFGFPLLWLFCLEARRMVSLPRRRPD